ncbi:beta-aspartyl-peptidase [Aeromonas cavernicola]|uniref:Beta-aspartyl-peptidase n=1 Tax=Aeromonas cavernicola TaxID=1006623 RepID=A0A2H9U1B6_9GAMM|nr:BCCT family transporter [Aeromonas cavernicola]PJG57748.1 beta-aspartyl-peptidase [Aeromonas cavernicola]
MSTPLPITTPAQARLNPIVFYGSTSLILLLTAALMLFPEQAGAWLGRTQTWLSHSFGWYYMLAIGSYLFFVCWVAFSRFGQLKLGADHEQPDFSYGAWAGMLFSSGIGISLLYFAASEPIDHLYNPPEGVAGSSQAARQSIQLMFLHWGIHGWAIYALVGLAVGYFAYRHKQPLALRSALLPILGARRVKGAAGHAVDCFGIFVTLVGLVTNLGIGALQVSSGLEYLFGMTHSNTTLLVVLLVMSVVATLAAVSGVEKGIRRLSNLNILLFSSLLLFVLLFGPTLDLLNGFVQNLGDYANGLILKTFDLYVYTDGAPGKNVEWLGLWTLFYWGWWISWAPFVGMFIARISRGRTVRELVLGVLLIPLAFTLMWLSVFGNSAMDLVLNQDATALAKAALEQPSMSIYLLLEHYPFAKVVIGLSIFVGFVLFLTPADSGSVMLANLSRQGGDLDEDAPHWLRILWSVVITVVTIGLLFAGNFTAMQTVVVLAGLPFSVILILFMVGLYKTMKADCAQADANPIQAMPRVANSELLPPRPTRDAATP